MFKLNLKIAFRNLWKNRFYSAINIFGLATGLTGFIIILLYINYETGFDKWDDSLDRTYIVAADFTKNGSENKGTKIKGLLSTILSKQIKEVESVSIGSLNGSSFEFKVDKGDKTIKNFKPTGFIDTNFFKTYPLKSIQGKMEDVFTAQNAIAISRTMAIEFFGDENSINKIITKTGNANFPDLNLIVKAVWDDEKQPSAFGFDMLWQDKFEDYGNQLLSTPFTTLFRLRKDVDHEKILREINDAYIIALAKYTLKNADANFRPTKKEALQILKDKEGITSFKLIAEPLSNLNLSDFYSKNAKQTTIYVLISLASFLIVISCINYTNLALVMAQSRAKEVGVKKVLGAFRLNLVNQFFAEAAIQCFIAYLLAFILVELALPQVNQLLDNNLSLFKSSNIVWILTEALLILIAVIFIAGIYPAFILAGFKPVKVLKGNFSTSIGIGSLRKTLVVLQFTLAVALVISFGVIYAQVDFMKRKDLGLKPNQLLSFRVAKFSNRVLSPANFETIKNRLLAVNGVEEVTRATEQPINDSGFSDDISFKNVKLNTESRYVDPNYLAVIGAKIIKGRDFSYQLLSTDSTQSVILNETAFKKLGMINAGQQISLLNDDGDKGTRFNVIGVVKDIQTYGFDQEIMPSMYLVHDYPTHWRTNIILRLNTSRLSSTMEDLKKVWKEIEPIAEPKFVFVDEVFAKMNSSYETSEKIIFSFGMITLIISIFGLIGFAAYNAKIRTKEIAIRKILGATVLSLLRMLNIDFIKLVMIATLLADVLAYIYMQRWFTGFAYRIAMPYQIFILVNCFVLLVTIFTVCIQSIRAIKANPVDALKYE